MSILNAPAILDMPPNLPSNPATKPSSAKAPPIPAKPLPISSQEREPILFKLSAMSSRDLHIINMLTALAIEFLPPNLFRITTDAVSSAKAPPIPAKPLPISSHERPLNLDNASAKILQLVAKAIITIAVFNDGLLFSTIFNAATNSPNPIPIATRPLKISLALRPESLTMALLRILIATDIAINAIPALTTSPGLNLFNVLENDLKLRLSIVNISAIAISDLPISLTCNFAMDESAAESIPIAIAILTNEATLMPVVKLANAS